MADKITIELPRWAKDRNIYVLAGIELLAYRLRGGKLMIKVSRCSKCGKCCMNLKPIRKIFPPIVDGKCVFLTKQGPEYICGLGVMRPHSCNIGVPSKDKIPECTEVFEEYK